MTTPPEAPPPPAPPPPPAAPQGLTLKLPGRISPVILIVVAVGAILVFGLIVFFLARAIGGGGGGEAAAAQDSQVLTPLPDQPQPSVQPLPTNAPVPIPAPSSPQPMPTSAAPVPMPEPTSAAPMPEPTQPEPGPAPASGEVFELPSGASVVVPAGWTGAESDNGAFVFLNGEGEGAVVGSYTGDPSATGIELMSYYITNELSQVFPSDLALGQAEAINAPNPNVTSAGRITYTGTFVGQQGSVPVEGIIFGFVRGDGECVIVDVYTTGPDVNPDAQLILASIISTL